MMFLKGKLKFYGLALLFLALAAVFCAPLLAKISSLGGNDWDHYTFWNAVAKKSIVEYGQFPLWNPYAGGGNLLLAHPLSTVFGPFFPLLLLFPLIVGLKLQIVLSMVVGLWGMYLLMREFKTSGLARFLAAVVYMFSSVFALHITEGHLSWTAQAWLPWAFLFFRRSKFNINYLYACAAVLTAVFFSGDKEILSISFVFLGVFSLFESIKDKSPHYLKAFGAVVVLFAGLSAIKLFPAFEYVREFPRATGAGEGLGAADVLSMLLKRGQSQLYQLPPSLMFLRRGWHEYGAYIGLGPLIFALCAAVIYFKKYWPIVATAVVMFFIVMGAKAPVDIWKVIHMLPAYNNIRMSCRYILVLVFCAAVLCGLGMNFFWASKKFSYKHKKVLLSLVFCFIAFDLTFINSRIFRSITTVHPLRSSPEKQFIQKYDYMLFPRPNFRSNMYQALLNNQGTVSAYEVLQIEPADISTEYYTPSFYENWLLTVVSKDSSKQAVFIEENPPYIELKAKGSSLLEASRVQLSTYIYSFAHDSRKAVFDFYSAGRDIRFFADGVECGISPHPRRQQVLSVTFDLKPGWNKVVFDCFASKGVFLKLLCMPKDIYRKYINDIYFSADKKLVEKRVFKKNPHYKGEVYLLGGYGSVGAEYLSPNKIIVKADLAKEDSIIVNQNYFKGWRLLDSRRRRYNVQSANGLISSKVPKGSHTLTFYYLPGSFMAGSLVSLIFLLFCSLRVFLSTKKRSKNIYE